MPRNRGPQFRLSLIPKNDLTKQNINGKIFTSSELQIALESVHFLPEYISVEEVVIEAAFDFIHFSKAAWFFGKKSLLCCELVG